MTELKRRGLVSGTGQTTNAKYHGTGRAKRHTVRSALAKGASPPQNKDMDRKPVYLASALAALLGGLAILLAWPRDDTSAQTQITFRSPMKWGFGKGSFIDQREIGGKQLSRQVTMYQLGPFRLHRFGTYEPVPVEEKPRTGADREGSQRVLRTIGTYLDALENRLRISQAQTWGDQASAARQDLGNIQIELDKLKRTALDLGGLEALLSELEGALRSPSAANWQSNSSAAHHHLGNIRIELQQLR